jgi:hypothetical protein
MRAHLLALRDPFFDLLSLSSLIDGLGELRQGRLCVH